MTKSDCCQKIHFVLQQVQHIKASYKEPSIFYLADICFKMHLRKCPNMRSRLSCSSHASNMSPSLALPEHSDVEGETKCFPDQILNENSSLFCVNRSIFVNDFCQFYPGVRLGWCKFEECFQKIDLKGKEERCIIKFSWNSIKSEPGKTNFYTLLIKS